MTTPAIFSSLALTIGSDGTYAAQGDAYDGSAVKIAPSSTQLSQGARPLHQLPAQARNWIDNQFAQIMSQLIADDGIYNGRITALETSLPLDEARITSIESWITNNSPRIKVYPFLVNGTFVVPARCVAAMYFGCGGGGQGGNGALGTGTADQWQPGAGAGSAAIASSGILQGLTPGETINVDVGAGGNSGSTAPSAAGQDGAPTIIRRGSTPLVTLRGGQAGMPVNAPIATQANFVSACLGGVFGASNGPLVIGQGSNLRFDPNTGGAIFGPGGATLMIPSQLAQGGAGTGGGQGTTIPSQNGAANSIGGFTAGVAGARGFDGEQNSSGAIINPTKRGGGGGGGGGAGPFGPGGNGGPGASGDRGAGIYQQVTVNLSGVAAVANSGGGGGGSGSSSYRSQYLDALANAHPIPVGGGPGGSGRCYIITVEES